AEHAACAAGRRERQLDRAKALDRLTVRPSGAWIHRVGDGAVHIGGVEVVDDSLLAPSQYHEAVTRWQVARAHWPGQNHAPGIEVPITADADRRACGVRRRHVQRGDAVGATPVVQYAPRVRGVEAGLRNRV